jgi:hypothetical protein
VRVAVALEFVMEISVGVEVENGEPGMARTEPAEHRICDRMIAA